MDPYERVRQRLENALLDISIATEMLKTLDKGQPDATETLRPADFRAQHREETSAEIIDLFDHRKK